MFKFYKLFVVLVVVFVFGVCDVNKIEEGELFSVDVDGGELFEYDVVKKDDGEMLDIDVEGGNMFEYDVDIVDVDVCMEIKEVEVFVVDIDMLDEDEEEVDFELKN